MIVCTTGSLEVVRLNNISVCPSLQLGHCGVMVEELSLYDSFSATVKSKNEPANALEKSWFDCGCSSAALYTVCQWNGTRMCCQE